jgi:hypothetical protein
MEEVMDVGGDQVVLSSNIKSRGKEIRARRRIKLDKMKGFLEL